MRRERNICLECPGRVDVAERIPPTETVSRYCESSDVETGPEIGDGGVDDGVRHIRAVGGQERGRVERRVVQIRRRRLPVEHVRGDGEVSGSCE